jgi:hypothetical protein
VLLPLVKVIAVSEAPKHPAHCRFESPQFVVVGEAPGVVTVGQASEVVAMGYAHATPGLAQVGLLAESLPWY